MSFRGISILSILFVGPIVSITVAEDVRLLTWDNVVKMTSESNPDLLSAQHSLEASRYQYKGSFNGVLPKVNLTNSYIDSKGQTSQSDHWDARGSVSLDLFNQSDYAGIASSHASLDQSSANLQNISATVFLNLRSAFAGLLYSQQAIDVSKSVLDIRKTNATMVSLRYDSGRESKGNRLRAQAELIQAEMDLKQANRDLRVSQEQLVQQIGADFAAPVLATGTLVTAQSTDNLPAMESFVENNPQILLQQAEVRSANASVRQAQSDLWPSLTANYVRSLQGPDYFPDRPDWTASGVLSLPIFGSGPTASYYAISSAKRLQKQAEENLRSSRYQVRIGLESAWSSYSSTVDQVKVQTAFLLSARQRNAEADVRYSNGLMTYDDWEIIVSDRVNFERSFIRAERDAVVAEAQWNKARGIELGGK